MKLFLYNIKRICLSLEFWLIVTVLFVLCCSNAIELFERPYDSQESYEKELGIIPYQEFQDITYEEFSQLMNYDDEQMKQIEVYESILSVDERAQLCFEKIFDEDKYKTSIKQYIDNRKIYNYKLVDFDDLKKMKKKEYECYQYSIYVPRNSGTLLYFREIVSNDYEFNYPTYEEAEALWNQENITALISREYYARIQDAVMIGVLILLVFFFIQEYSCGTIKMVCISNVKCTEYILTKYFAVIVSILFSFFVISVGVAETSILLVNRETVWIYELSDYINTFCLTIIPSTMFVSSLALLSAILFKDYIFSFVPILGYILASSARGLKLENGIMVWRVEDLKYYPRLPFALGAMDYYREAVLQHQMLYSLLGISILIIAIVLWKYQRGKEKYE